MDVVLVRSISSAEVLEENISERVRPAQTTIRNSSRGCGETHQAIHCMIACPCRCVVKNQKEFI
eukprot:2776281-Amphidinium_carterae.1